MSERDPGHNYPDPASSEDMQDIANILLRMCEIVQRFATASWWNYTLPQIGVLRETEERRAWDMYAAAALACPRDDSSVENVTEWADSLLRARQQRFPVKP